MLCTFRKFNHGLDEVFFVVVFWGANGANEFIAVLAARRDKFMRMGVAIHMGNQRLLMMGLTSNDKNNKSRHKNEENEIPTSRDLARSLKVI